MKKTTHVLFFSLCFLLSFSSFAATVKGILIDEETSETLIGASILIQGTTMGTVTGIDGSFVLTDVPTGKNVLVFHYMGYQDKEQAISINSADQVLELGKISLASDAVGLNEVRVIASVAVDRKTPIAVSNIKPEQIVQKLGTQEFPEILKSTPGVYATKRGGGFGDADVRIRGFASSNVAVLINGMPVNGMEDDKVYWSNWAGLADVSQTMQVQRGVGASKIAVPSVGGTINVLTKTTDAKQGGNVFYSHGNDGYHKYGATFSTGLSENNWAVTLNMSRTTGNGYVQGTPFESYSYFFNISKKINDKHSLAFTLFGAPQEHAKRYTQQSLSILSEKEDGHRFNSDWGYRNGQFYSNSTNFYHKPVAMLNHYWSINSSTFLSTSVYGSYGIGGGGYVTTNGVSLSYNTEGHIDWDQVVEDNKAYAAQGQGGGIYFQNSFNNHAWYGALSTLKKELGYWNFLAGVDLRYYYGEHWQQADDLFEADYIIDQRNVDAIYSYGKAIKQGQTLYYDNDGEVMWGGLFGQAEYSNDQLSAFGSITLSNRSYRRYDFMQYFTEEDKEAIANDLGVQREWESRLSTYMSKHGYESILESEAYLVDQVTDWQNFFAYSAKAGANYNLDDHHNVFVNGGYMTRQPIFSSVFQSYKNVINKEAVNEKVLSAEIGYGYRSSVFSGNVNLYYTKWKDKTRTGNIQSDEDPDVRYFYNIQGINARHMGLEFDGIYKPTDKIDITAMVSLGDWIWANNVDTVEVFDGQNLVGRVNKMYLKGVHVADAAQTTAALGFNFELLPGLKVGIDMNYYDRLYADFEINSRTTPEGEGIDAERIPAYMLFDANLYYKFKLGDLDASLYSNMHNIMNTIYIADATEGNGYYFGYGRTWSVGMKVRF